jgi:hypothetical protein
MQGLDYTSGMLKQVQPDNKTRRVTKFLKLRNSEYYMQDKRWEKYPA